MASAGVPDPPRWTSTPRSVPEDRLKSLATALDPGRMSAVLAPWVRERFGGDAVIRELQIEVYRRHANRCVIRYGLDCRVGPGGTRPWQVIGKVLPDDRGAEVYETMRRLWELGFARDASDRIAMPEPIAYEPSLGMLLQEVVGGTAVRALIKQSSDPAPCRVTARALAKLHRSDLRVGPPRRVPDHLRRCHPRYPFLALACPEVADQVEAIVDRSLAVEAALGEIEPAALHGDFHLGQVHLEGDRAWLVDFDAVGQGDPASDLGNLAVFLKDKARKRPAASGLLEAFLGEYFARMDPAIAARIPLYEALTHLRRACKLLRVQAPGWRERVHDMMARGLGAIEAMEAGLPRTGGARRATDGRASSGSGRTRAARGGEPAGFERIRVGRQVRVKGVRAADGTMQAVEIEGRGSDGRVLLEGVATSIDPRRREIVLLGRTVPIPDGIAPSGPDGRDAPLGTEGSRARVRIVGRDSGVAGLRVESIQLEETQGFGIEKVEGRVDAIDRGRRTLVIAGVTVRVTPDTLVERLA